MDKFFSESDCDSWAKDGEPRISIKKANQLLSERSTVVYGKNRSDMDNHEQWEWCNKQAQGNSDTHRALLICVEEIEKEKPTEVVSNFDVSVFGLNEEQIKHCKDFYESRTGERAKDIGKEKKDSVEKILEELILLQKMCNGPGEFLIDPSNCSTLGRLCARAKRLLGGEK